MEMSLDKPACEFLGIILIDEVEVEALDGDGSVCSMIGLDVGSDRWSSEVVTNVWMAVLLVTLIDRQAVEGSSTLVWSFIIILIQVRMSISLSAQYG